jgi:uncharacterized protein (TIGR02646 family)
MKFIRKNEEPASFIAWKQQASPEWQPNWDNFQKPEKLEVHRSLLIEQGYICCYCGQRIAKEESHIEHFQPRTTFPELTLSYGNFLASCPGYTEETETETPIAKRSQEFCGQQKGAWYDPMLTVSPLQPDCETYFRYTGQGAILPTQDNVKAMAAETTIEKLALNHSRLNRSRKRVIEGILQDIETFSEDELTQLMQAYNHPDSDGNYVPFCGAVIYILEQFRA